MRPVVISGVGMIPFERRDDDRLVDMLAMAGLQAIDDAGLGDHPVDAVAQLGLRLCSDQAGVERQSIRRHLGDAAMLPDRDIARNPAALRG